MPHPLLHPPLISNLLLILLALTPLPSFLLPSFQITSTITILRFPLIFIPSIFPFIPISFPLSIILINLSPLESLRVPYLSPVPRFNC
ncbi:spore germination protein, partial [Bacillus pumilus]|uniref:spore germination protein n=1 Tax=Bacillus pumilus TaxID=1408 RepID=UPI0028CB5956